jgi:hypothetical protein
MIKIFFQDDPLIKVFDHYRDLQENAGDKLSENYQLKNFSYKEQEVFTIGYKDNDPHIFSTIFRRPWWPPGAYRILNRMWKVSRQEHIAKTVDLTFIEMVEKQIDWLKENKDFTVAFMSREHDSKNTLENFAQHLNKLSDNYQFNVFENRVWVCEGSAEHCFQDILYTGDKRVLDSWKLKD